MFADPGVTVIPGVEVMRINEPPRDLDREDLVHHVGGNHQVDVHQERARPSRPWGA